MMTVLYIIDYGTVGGATVAIRDLVFQMQLKGITPIVVTGKRNEFNNFLERHGVKTIAAGHRTAIEPFTLRSWRSPLRFVKLVMQYYVCEYYAMRVLKKSIDFSAVDIIHTNSARNTLGSRISKRYHIPHIVHIREFGDADFGCLKLTPYFYKMLDQHSTAFISVSEAVKDHWTKKGIDANKNELIYDGVRYEDISESQDTAKKDNILRLVIAGGVCEPKGQHLIIEAAGLLPKEIRENLRLDIMGWYGKEYLMNIIQKSERIGFLKQITFHGAINDVHQRLGQYQIGLMCSRSEGFGLVTAEYMHARLGVIASDSGANPELIEDGVTGLLFKSGDAKSLAECITRFYNDRELLIRVSNAAQKKARTLYTQEKNAEAIYSLYKQLLEKK